MTFIRSVSAATPKWRIIRSRLVRNLGVVSIEEHRSFVIADIPGPIEGAADGAGLGAPPSGAYSAAAAYC